MYDRWHKSHPKPGEADCAEHRSRTRPMVPTADHGIGKRWQVRYRDLDQQQRKENFETKAAADNRAAEVDVELRHGTYVAPSATKETLASYAQKWLEANSAGPTTALRYEATVRNHITAHLGRRELRSLNQPSTIQGWIRKLQDTDLGASTIEGIFDVLSSILGAAVDDGLLPKNPCKASSVKLPTVTKKKVVPWTLERVRAVIAGLPKRFQGGGKLAFGCGLRQGEVFGIADTDIDFKGGWIHVNRQVRIVGTKAVFALPKGNRIRSVPLSAQLAAALKVHMKEFSPTAVTLPWGKPDGEPKTFRLLFVDEKGRAYNRSVFNQGVWKLALAAAGVIPPRERGAKYLQSAPEDGMHALRHAYASVLLDAGESIKALSEYLGHSDPGFTLRTYTHLLPTSETRTRKAIDAAFTDEGDGTEAEGTPRARSSAVCPQCALAA
ncbi:tyrosine-type recombinase/integrase [Streptomyces sp. NBC_00239]|uniref:tyrosine-type recombinase/integrase n=1 Tax=Streptomyces sp. NBC_00239 TaxID=2903640 RepID=UPI002E2A335B|nr:tyrosine-type recombinase/integrase [Streptomyces sp. NBC_00239]